MDNKADLNSISMECNQKHQKKSKQAKKLPTIPEEYIFEQGVDQDGQEYLIPYEVGEFLGKGGFASCYEVTVAEEKQMFAVKIFKKDVERKNNIQKIHREIQMMTGLDHPNIVKLYRSFQNDDKVFLILQLCQQGSLFDIIGQRETLTEPEVRYLVSQLVPALVYLKEKRIIHQDIKMGNIFFDEQFRVKLGDFGLAIHCSKEFVSKKQKIAGTPGYMAPEVFTKKPYDFSVDLWSLGILIYNLLLGRQPFDGEERKEIQQQILSYKQLPFEGFTKKKKVSKLAKSFLENLIQRDVKKRLKLENVMAHPFMQKFQIPQALQPSFSKKKPSKEFLERYQRQLCSQEASEKGSQSEVITVIRKRKLLTKQQLQRKKSQPVAPLNFYKRNQNYKLKRMAQGDMSGYFGDVQKRFCKNTRETVSKSISPGLKKTLKVEDIKHRYRNVFKDQKELTFKELAAYFQFNQTKQESTEKRDQVRVIYTNQEEGLWFAYLTNCELFGIFLDKQNYFLVHSIRHRVTFKLWNIDGVLKSKKMQIPIAAPQRRAQTIAEIFNDELENAKGYIKQNNDQIISEASLNSSRTFIREYRLSKNTQTYDLSNGVIQVDFSSKVTLFVYASSQRLVFIDKQDKRTQIKLDELQDLSEEGLGRAKIAISQIEQMKREPDCDDEVQTNSNLSDFLVHN